MDVEDIEDGTGDGLDGGGTDQFDVMIASRRMRAASAVCGIECNDAAEIRVTKNVGLRAV